MDFPCTMCGACCRRARSFLAACKEAGIDSGYDYPVNDDGSCGHLIEVTRPDGQPGWGCEIYDTRPNLCRINHLKPESVSVEEHALTNMKACNELQELDNMPTLYRVLL